MKDLEKKLKYSFKIKVADFVFLVRTNSEHLYNKLIQSSISKFRTNKRKDFTLNLIFKKKSQMKSIDRETFQKKEIKIEIDSLKYIRMLFSEIVYYWLFKKGILTLHASAIIHKNKAFVFVGVPGSGKTTHAKILGFPTINDNEILIRFRDGKAFAYSGIIKRKNIEPSKLSAPIKKIFILRKSKKFNLKELNDSYILKELIKNHYILKCNLKNYKDLILFIKLSKKLISTTKFYLLYSNLDKIKLLEVIK